VFILFSGSLDTDWRSIRPALKQGTSLATIGVVLTAGDEFLVSTGRTVIQAADTLLILADQDQFRQVADALTGRAAE